MYSQPPFGLGIGTLLLVAMLLLLFLKKKASPHWHLGLIYVIIKSLFQRFTYHLILRGLHIRFMECWWLTSNPKLLEWVKTEEWGRSCCQVLFPILLQLEKLVCGQATPSESDRPRHLYIIYFITAGVVSEMRPITFDQNLFFLSYKSDRHWWVIDSTDCSIQRILGCTYCHSTIT